LKGVKIIKINTPSWLNKFKYFFTLMKTKKVIFQINPDILIGYRVSSYGFMGAYSGFHPFVLVPQGYNIDNPEKSWCKEHFIRYSISHADMYQAWGDHMARRMEKLGADPNKISIFPRGVDISKFSLSEYPQKPFTLIMTRGLKDGYDLDIPFRALAELRDSAVDFKFIVAGDGPIKNNLVRLAEELKISRNVSFLGYVDNHNLPKILRSAHVYVSPVPTDGVSTSLLEAMSCGLIPIVIDNDANRLWIHNGENGFLIQPNNYHEMAKAILRVEKRDIDIDEIRKINRELVSNKANWRVNMKRLEAEFQFLIKRN
jgi:glycosyltransferase involved in cell wall biosynthesis